MSRLTKSQNENLRRDITFLSKEKIIQKYNIGERNYYYKKKEFATGIKGYKFENKQIQKDVKRIEKEKISQIEKNKKISHLLRIRAEKERFYQVHKGKTEIYQPEKPQKPKELKEQKYIYDRNIKKAQKSKFINVQMQRYIEGKYYLITNGIIDQYSRTFKDDNTVDFVSRREDLKARIKKFIEKEKQLFRALIRRNNLYEYNGYVFFNNILTNERLFSYKFEEKI